ncbi:MAG: folate-binding protein YgfZ [Alphaproteobacteria bacterium]|nr:folate-binding protein YgfZ [Alphaproteobacteria bacterium]
MSQGYWAILPARGVVELAGADRVGFLQGLISADVSRLAPDHAGFGALLTAQGRWLHDFFLFAPDAERVWLDAEAARRADLVRRLSMFRLRAKVTIADRGADLLVAAAWGEGAAARFGLGGERGAAAPFAGGIAAIDPRLAAAGVRLVLPRAGAEAALAATGLSAAIAEDYDRHRLGLGLPDGSADLAPEKALLLEAGFDELGGIDWKKGCYVGQELTARMHYRGLVKKRLLRVAVEGPLPAAGTPVMQDGTEAGEMRSGRDGTGLALLRLDAVETAAAGGAPLTCGEARLRADPPGWAILPQPKPG